MLYMNVVPVCPTTFEVSPTPISACVVATLSHDGCQSPYPYPLGISRPDLSESEKLPLEALLAWGFFFSRSICKFAPRDIFLSFSCKCETRGSAKRQ